MSRKTPRKIPNSAIKRIVASENDSPSAVAAKLSEPRRKCDRQLVQYWMANGVVTPNWALRVNEVYGTPLHDLNPSIYPQSAA